MEEIKIQKERKQILPSGERGQIKNLFSSFSFRFLISSFSLLFYVFFLASLYVFPW